MVSIKGHLMVAAGLAFVSGIWPILSLSQTNKKSQSSTQKVEYRVALKDNKPLNMTAEADPKKPITVSFPDGRQATLKVSESSKTDVTIPFSVEETTCSEYRPRSCRLIAEFQFSSYRLIWTKHPDKKKINQLVKTFDQGDGTSSASRSAQEREAFDESVLWSFEDYQLIPDRQMKPMRIECDDFRFMTGDPKEKRAPEAIQIIEWASELMSENFETDVEENRTVSGALDVRLERVAEGALRIQSIGTLVSRFSLPDLIDGDLIGWTLPLNGAQSSSAFCDVTLKLDVQSVIPVAQKLQRESVEAPSHDFIREQRPFEWQRLAVSLLRSQRGLVDPYNVLAQLNLIDVSTEVQSGSHSKVITYQVSPRGVR